jgi:hypothetical protein
VLVGRWWHLQLKCLKFRAVLSAQLLLMKPLPDSRLPGLIFVITHNLKDAAAAILLAIRPGIYGEAAHNEL